MRRFFHFNDVTCEPLGRDVQFGDWAVEVTRRDKGVFLYPLSLVASAGRRMVTRCGPMTAPGFPALEVKVNFPSLSVVAVEKGPGVGLSSVDLGLKVTVKSATGVPSKVTVPVTGARANPSPTHPIASNGINATNSESSAIVVFEICLLITESGQKLSTKLGSPKGEPK